MKYKIDHDYHIHTILSSCCSDENQTAQNILDYAKRNKLNKICITDHYWDSDVLGASDWYKPQNFDHVIKNLPLPKSNDVTFLFGCETDMDKNFQIGIPPKRYNSFDFIIIPTTHLHMTDFTISSADSKSNEKRAKLWVERFGALLNMDLPFNKIGIAHLACDLINFNSRKDLIDTINLIKSDDMERLFSKASKLKVGIELNQGDMTFNDNEADVFLRPFKIAKNCGCKFYLGSDSHNQEWFKNTINIFERAINLLDLKESDKFVIME